MNFRLQTAPLPDIHPIGLTFQSIDVDNLTSKFDLAVELWETGSRLVGRVEYSTDLFEPPTIALLAADFERVLAEALDAPRVPITELPIPLLLRPAPQTMTRTKRKGISFTAET